MGGAAARRASGALGGEDTDDAVEKGLAAPRPFAEEEDEQYCDGCHAPVSDPAACKACKKKLCYACAKTTAEEYEEASPGTARSATTDRTPPIPFFRRN